MTIEESNPTIEEQIRQAKLKLQISRMALQSSTPTYENLEQNLSSKMESVKQAHMQSHAESYGLYYRAESAVKEHEKELRDLLAKYFQQTGNKQFDKQLSVRVNTRLEYAEPEALEWAKKHGLCLALDKKAFEKIASVQSLDFVKPVDVASAVIAKDLAEDKA